MQCTIPNTYPNHMPLVTPESYTGWAPIDARSFSARVFRKKLDEIMMTVGLWNWNAIELFQGTKSDGTSEPVLLITIFPEDKSKIPWVYQALRPFGNMLQCDVLVQTGTPSKQLGEEMKCGSSVAASTNPHRHGSIGGFLRIGDDVVGTTCHHVVFDGIGHPKINTDGFVPSNQVKVMAEKSGVLVSSPSCGFYEKVAIEELEQAKRRMGMYKKKCIENDLMPEELEAHELDVTHHEEALEMTRKRCWAGKIMYDCGELHSTDWYGRITTVDWTVFSIDPLRKVMQPINTLTLSDITPYRENTCEIKGFHNLGDMTMRGGLDVWKYGFRSQCTRGRTNGVCSRIYLGPYEKLPSAKKAYTDEICILADPGTQFSIDGDSGSWVVGSNHELFGFLFAGTAERPSRSYMTDINLLLTELTAATGTVPELPLPTVEMVPPPPSKDMMYPILNAMRFNVNRYGVERAERMAQDLENEG